MGKVLSLLVGAIVTVGGAVLLVLWRYEFLLILKGVIPGAMILGGTIALLAGVSEFKDTFSAKTK